jgi:uncharacterized protein YqeY
MTKQQLKEELKKSMLAKDTSRTSALRMALSALGYYEIQKGGAGYEATEEDVQAVLQKEVKQRKDSIEQFKAAGRDELVEKETHELGMLEAFLPEQMDEEAIRKLVADAVEKSGAAGPQDMGKVMGVLMPQIKGKADGGLVSRIVKEALI